MLQAIYDENTFLWLKIEGLNSLLEHIQQIYYIMFATDLTWIFSIIQFV